VGRRQQLYSCCPTWIQRSWWQQLLDSADDDDADLLHRSLGSVGILRTELHGPLASNSDGDMDSERYGQLQFQRLRIHQLHGSLQPCSRGLQPVLLMEQLVKLGHMLRLLHGVVAAGLSNRSRQRLWIQQHGEPSEGKPCLQCIRRCPNAALPSKRSGIVQH